MPDPEYGRMIEYLNNLQVVQQHAQQLTKYPGSGGTETNGAKTAGGTYDATTQKMIQTVYNLLRANGMLA